LTATAIYTAPQLAAEPTARGRQSPVKTFCLSVSMHQVEGSIPYALTIFRINSLDKNPADASQHASILIQYFQLLRSALEQLMRTQ